MANDSVSCIRPVQLETKVSSVLALSSPHYSLCRQDAIAAKARANFCDMRSSICLCSRHALRFGRDWELTRELLPSPILPHFRGRHPCSLVCAAGDAGSSNWLPFPVANVAWRSRESRTARWFSRFSCFATQLQSSKVPWLILLALDLLRIHQS